MTGDAQRLAGLRVGLAGAERVFQRQRFPRGQRREPVDGIALRAA
jgi:hypothetical protein